MSIKEDAIKKLSKGGAKLSSRAEIVREAVIDQLVHFCEINDEFAQAVVQTKKTAADCLEYVVKGCGNSISDFTCFKRAAEFWFPGATVSFNVTIDLGDGGTSSNETISEVSAATANENKLLKLDLDDLL